MIERIAKLLNIHAQAVSRVIELFESGATIPFIARYRKEASGGLNEVDLMAIKDEWEKQQEIEKRQAFILEKIEEQGKLTDELAKKIKNCFELHLLEDLYLPYKKKRKTRADKAREFGLEPLSELLWAQKDFDLDAIVEPLLSEEVLDEEDALEGARDIIAERINQDETARATVRQHYQKRARFKAAVVAGKEEEAQKYKNYFELDRSLKQLQAHQILAVLRAEKEGLLKVQLAPNEDYVLNDLCGQFIRRSCPDRWAEQLDMAIEDAYKRLMKPSISNEFVKQAKAQADLASIQIFAENLRQLLLASPLGNKRMMAIDPGYATGCKLVCLSATGELLEDTVIYPTPPRNRKFQATDTVLDLIEKHRIEAISIGNGTAGRETEQFIRQLPFEGAPPAIFLVNESGASIYSASEIARQEFPDKDITVRGAVSIGRRLMDPLAELVKIDPKSIGVGQYQHDVDQKQLQNKLGAVVESCVNAVGVDLNTASEYLLTYVSGLGPALARNIVDYRRSKGAFKSRQELRSVKRLGEKAFEQAAGFLRIRKGIHPLDNTGVHPEAYPIVEQMAKDLNASIADLIADKSLRKKIQLKDYVRGEIGLPSLHDIMKELEKPGRDPRPPRQVFQFADVHQIEDLKEGMKLPGIVTNITAFGAFVDLGIKENGLLHKSQMSHQRVDDPARFVKLGQELEVTIVGLELGRKRIQLSIIE